VAEDLRQHLPALIPPLRAYARGLTGSREAADDLVQEALLRALRAAAQYQPETPLRAWVFTILRNCWIDAKRRQRRERHAIQALGDEGTRAHTAPVAHGVLALDDLATAMMTLPATQREALLLVAAQGLDIAEAALICGVPEGTMRARVSRARDALRDRMPTGRPHDA